MPLPYLNMGMETDVMIGVMIVMIGVMIGVMIVMIGVMIDITTDSAKFPQTNRVDLTERRRGRIRINRKLVRVFG
ncbi:MAG: hypothetical protein ACREA2_05670 [Blastocatellia bacterium]